MVNRAEAMMDGLESVEAPARMPVMPNMAQFQSQIGQLMNNPDMVSDLD